MSINIPSQNTKITARIKTGTRNINQVRFNCIDIVKHSGPDVTTLYNWANQITDDLAEDITVVFSSTCGLYAIQKFVSHTHIRIRVRVAQFLNAVAS